MSNPSHSIQINEKTFQCPENMSLLLAMGRAGEKDIPVGCRAGGCGVCKIQIISGEFDVKVMSRTQVSEQEQAENLALACRVYPRSNMVVERVTVVKT